MDGFPAMRGNEMLCPICGWDYTSVTIGRSIGDGDYPDTGYPDFRPRGGAFALQGECEAGCTFEILIGFHKGSTKVATYGKSATERACEGVQFDSAVEKQFWLAIHHDGPDYIPESLRGLVPQHSVNADGNQYRIDFADPERKLAIEIDGLAYHNGQDSFMRDRRRERDLQMDGWRVIRFAAKEVMNDARACVRQASEWASA